MTNIGPTDRVIRIFGGVTIASMLIYFNSSFAMLGLIPFITGVIGICPLYKVTGISTVKSSRQ